MSLNPLPRFVVSVQAEDHEPLAPTPIMLALCESVLAGGAEGLRLANVELIRQVKQKHPMLPIIGLHKPYPLPNVPKEVVYITRSLDDALALAEAGADIVALDATPRPREQSLAEIVSTLKQAYPQVKIMGDVDSIASAHFAVEAGVDILSSTLNGYTLETQDAPTASPNFEFLEDLVKTFPTLPVYLEGRVWDVADVHRGLGLGAYGVVIGSAITRPHQITARFKTAF
ncbi:MAG: N-acetylmannosamine-6-phosphate 2-epimerase [Vampirovibrionales bacterium]|jgi:N-acylglucosamine-6-phosphate 2-epimerase